MPNPYYNHGTTPIASSSGSSALIRAEFDAVTTGFNFFPTLAANGSRAVIVNAGATALTVTTGTLALAGNFATTGAFNTTFTQQATVTLTLPLTSGTLLTDAVAPGQIWGLTMTATATDVTIAIGGAASDDATLANIVYLPFASALTKQLANAWVIGNNQGGRIAAAIANTTYHVFLLLVGSTVDAGFDTDVTGAAIKTLSAATKIRRIGSIMREAGSIATFVQVGNVFYRKVPTQSVNTTTPGIVAVTAVLNVPIGIALEASIVALISDTTPAAVNDMLVTSLTQTDSVPTDTNAQVVCDILAKNTSAPISIITDTSAQIRYRVAVSTATVIAKISTFGWTDTRGRNG